MRFALTVAAALIVAAAPSPAVEVCPSAPVYEVCEISLELTEAEAAEHPNPYLSVELRAEFRSPKGGRTKVMPGFWDGGRSFKIRFAPDFPGGWDLRLISNLPRIDKKTFSFDAGPARTPGFVEVFNTRYFRYSQENTGHYWMGDTCYRFATIPWDAFRQLVDRRAEQKFNHLRGLVLGWEQTAEAVLADPDRPSVEHFQEVDRRIEYMNQKGFTYDLLLAGDQNQLAELLPRRQQRERYVRYLVARYAAYNIVWQGVQEFEEYEDGRALLNEINGYIQAMDPYDHPRSTHAVTTSSPLIEDGWMTYVVEQTSSEAVTAIDYEMNLMPIVNTEFGYEDSGAGKSHQHHVDHNEFRKRLWRAVMRGAYPTYGNTGTYGGRKFDVDLKYLDSPGVNYMGHLWDFFNQTRYFDLQTYYQVEGGVALSMHYSPYLSERFVGVEFIVYVEKPGPIEVIVPKAGYDLSWFNPIDGTWINEKKKFKGDRFQAPGPPDPSHDWVLYLRREGKKESFNKNYYLEARGVKPKEIETKTSELPFEIQLPEIQRLTAGREYDFNATLTSSSRASKQMLWRWTAEVAGSGRAARVIGTSQDGMFRIPTNLVDIYPATLSVRLIGLDGAGRLFEAFKAYTLERE